ncbi:MAG: molybdopterin molybdenumtransferase MoeA [Candidatus Tectimicrobiota bacterium]|nr:MAG: molybdopterin molybdenumtransferase MoeA [Candidatus Tectomicrobia bacterium]
MITAEEALAIVLRHVQPLAPQVQPLLEALDCVLAQDVVAQEDLPPFPCSAKDGFAVIARDASNPRRLIGEQTAGYVAGLRVEPGTCVRITTGAPLPPGADAVIMVEDTQEANGMVTLLRPVAPGADVRPVGQDVAKGERVLAAGTCLGPQEIGLLASLGHSSVLVYPRPRVGVLSTGNEVVEPETPPRPGQIRDSNRYALMAALRRAGAQPVSLGIAPDEEAALTAVIDEALATCDAVITSGGVSMGKLDLIKPLLARRGQVHFGLVNMKPGKPLTFATVEGKPVFALPGFPVSSLVSFELFVRPALRKMSGHRLLLRPRVPVTLAEAIRGDAGRPEFHRAVVWRENGGYKARSTGLQSSGRLLSMVGANALLVLPQQDRPFQAGETVMAILLDHPETDPDPVAATEP